MKSKESVVQLLVINVDLTHLWAGLQRERERERERERGRKRGRKKERERGRRAKGREVVEGIEKKERNI